LTTTTHDPVLATDATAQRSWCRCAPGHAKVRLFNPRRAAREFTLDQAAARSGVSSTLLQLARAEGKLPSLLPADVDAWAAAFLAGAGAPPVAAPPLVLQCLRCGEDATDQATAITIECPACGSGYVRLHHDENEAVLSCASCSRHTSVDDWLTRYASHGLLQERFGRTSCLLQERDDKYRDPDSDVLHFVKADRHQRFEEGPHPDLPLPREILRGEEDDRLDIESTAAATSTMRCADALWRLRGKVLDAPKVKRRGRPRTRESFVVLGPEAEAVAVVLLETLVARGVDAEALIETIRKAGGSPALLEELHLEDGRIPAKRPRTTPFSSVAHALQVAFGVDAETMLGASFKGFATAESTHSLPCGIVFNQIAMAPSHNASARAQGEALVHLVHDARTAVRAARVGITTRGLDEVDLELLRLCVVGLVGRKEARRSGKTIVPAIERLRPKEAVFLMKGRVPGADGELRHLTEHEAKLRIRDAQLAIAEALHARRLIPEEEYLCTVDPSRRRPKPTPSPDDVARHATSSSTQAGAP